MSQEVLSKNFVNSSFFDDELEIAFISDPRRGRRKANGSPRRAAQRRPHAGDLAALREGRRDVRAVLGRFGRVPEPFDVRLAEASHLSAAARRKFNPWVG